MDIKKETARGIYLKNFERQNNANAMFGSGKTNLNEVGEQIVELMKKEDLTHQQAYATLQYAYNKIKYESNFLKLQ